MGNSVLFVDDEQSILRALRRAFHGASFDQRFAGSAAEALRLLAQQPADLVVADVRMPEMDGVELLGRVRDLYPRTVRVILSGQVDRDTVLRALSTGAARTFFAKPWDDEVFRGRIQHMLDVRTELSASGVLEIFSGISHLPAVPAVYTKLTEAIDRGRPLADLALIIEQDVGLTAKALQIINSALYGVSGVASVERAIALLGVETVRGIALMTSFVEQETWTPAQRALLDRIVAHSVLVQRFVSAAHPPSASEEADGSGVAGLLHDAGKILLLRHLPERYGATCELCSSDPRMSFYEAEKALGFAETSHARLGGYLLDGWNLPEPLVDAALYHHEPERASSASRTLVEAVAWVDGAIATSIRPTLPRSPAPSWLDPEKAQGLIAEMAAAVRAAGLHAC